MRLNHEFLPQIIMKFKLQSIPIICLAVLLSAWSYRTAEESNAPEIVDLKFGTISVNGTVYDTDVVIENGKARKRKKGPSRDRRPEFGHTPLTELEEIPWDCDTLVIGIGMSSRLPVVDEFKAKAKSKGVKLILLETPKAVEYFLKNYGPKTNAIFHVTC